MKDCKDPQEWAVEQCAEFDTAPICYYAQPFDFGRAIFFRIFCFPDPKNQKLTDRIAAKYREMYNVALKQYGGVPMRVRGRISKPPAGGRLRRGPDPHQARL